MSVEGLARALAILFRLFGGGILCFFAYAPAWIEYHAVKDAIADPRAIDAAWFTAIAVCSALTYFLLLLAFRAFTGRGRKEDGGLLPPLAIQGFAVTFGVIGATVSGFGLYTSHWGAVIGGLLEFLTAASVFQLASARRRRGRPTHNPG